MTEIELEYTTIRVTKALKSQIDRIASKKESYSDVLTRIVGESFAFRQIEESILDEVKKRKYVNLDDIDW